MFVTLKPMSTFELQGSPRDPVSIDYTGALNQEQLEVVLHGDGPCLVLAGAGSGKTRTLVYRVAYLLEQGVAPQDILLLTFTNKAAREMLARVEALVGDRAHGIWGGTFHAVASRILRVAASAFGYASSFSILDQEDARALVKAVMKEMGIDPKGRRFPSPAVVQDLLSYARNVGKPVEVVLQERYAHLGPIAKELLEIARQYQTRKKIANVMDFDDLLTYVAAFLDDPIHSEPLARRFRYVLVDEYQDTNQLQARIVHGFARIHQNVLVVGDDAQSIYAFRGADIHNILSFPREWKNAREFRLLSNYRSTPNILDVANASLVHNVDQFQKELISLRSQGCAPRLIPCSSASQEARYVAEQIQALQQEGLSLAQIAVLFRSSSHSQLLEFELIKRDIPYEYRGGQKFFERAHIKDTIAMLRIPTNPKDEVAWLRVLHLQSGIGAGTASGLIPRIKAFDDFDAVLLTDPATFVPSRGQEGWKVLLQTLLAIRGTGGLPGPSIRTICRGAYRAYVEHEYPNWQERLEDLEQLARFADGYKDTVSFLNDIALYDELFASRDAAHDSGRERVVLSTIHQAKGLEWEAVFVIHLAETAFPNRRAMEEQNGMEEERRLFYVAVTRAKTHLFLSYPMAIGREALVFQQPSTFLEEIPSRLFERVEIREPRAFGRATSGRKPWAFDAEEGEYEEPTIEMDRFGERSGSSGGVVLKPSTSSRPLSKPGSFLRDVDDL